LVMLRSARSSRCDSVFVSAAALDGCKRRSIKLFD
jgi:hypothetical protein